MLLDLSFKANRGLNRGRMPNQKIDRLWAEVNRVSSGYFKDLLKFTEDSD